MGIDYIKADIKREIHMILYKNTYMTILTTNKTLYLDKILVSDKITHFVNYELDDTLFRLETELAQKLENLVLKKGMMSEVTEEDYFRLIWKVYKLSTLWTNLKDLVVLYKHPDLPVEVKEKLKVLLINCNTALILSILSGIIQDKTESNYSSFWELISEWYTALTDALEKYEVDFSHEKSTKNTKITCNSITSDGFDLTIESNKPFWTLDINIKYKWVVESINIPMEWTEQENNMNKYSFILSFDKLENDYSELEEWANTSIVKFSVSKKVWHPSTFLTNQIYYSLKNYLVKNQPITINSNSFILRSQISKISSIYEERYNKLPSTRWLSIYLLIQNNERKTLTKQQYSLFLSKKSKQEFNDIELVLKENSDWSALVLLKNKDTKRQLMMRNKSASQKNKSNFTKFDIDVSHDLDEEIYTDEFEKRVQKKLKEIENIKYFINSVDSLDRLVGDEEWTTVWDLVIDDSELQRINENFESEYIKKLFLEMSQKVLSPKEYFYFICYYYLKIPLKELWLLGLYQDTSITEIKQILRKTFSKIIFWSKYPEYLNN